MSTNKHVALAYTYIEAIQALDLDGLSNILSPDLSFQFLPSASLGDMGKPLNRDAFFAVGRNLRALLKDSRLPMEILEVTDASVAGLVILHTKASGAFTVTGKQFTNEYLMMLWMKEVDAQLKIVRGQEFVDSAFVQSLGSQ